MHIAVFVPEYGALDGITPAYRAFNTANEFLVSLGKTPVFNVEYVGLNPYVSIGQGECVLQTDGLLSNLKMVDLLIIPPIFGNISNGLRRNAAAIPHFKTLYAQGASLASLCIGAFLLAETGLLTGKKCSTHWAYIEEFKSRYPQVLIEEGTIITEYDNIYSSGGANSLWNLLLYLIEKFSDRETAILVSKYFALDLERNSQSQFSIFKGQRKHMDEGIQQVQDYIETHYYDKISIEKLAGLINIGRRTFERRFKEATNNTPAAYMQRVRIEAAKKYFEASRKNVTEIMFNVGYTDTKAFRDTFRKITGLTPIEYRNKFAKISSGVA